MYNLKSMAFFARKLLCMQVILIALKKHLHERWKSQMCSRCWSYGIKYRKKLLQFTILLRKWIQLKVYGNSVKNVWISSLTLIVILWWIELFILRVHRKVYQNFLFKVNEPVYRAESRQRYQKTLNNILLHV